MKVLSFALRSFGRELRSGELLVLLSAITLAVAALTAVGFLTDRIGRAVERQANEVLRRMFGCAHPTRSRMSGANAPPRWASRSLIC